MSDFDMWYIVPPCRRPEPGVGTLRGNLDQGPSRKSLRRESRSHGHRTADSPRLERDPEHIISLVMRKPTGRRVAIASAIALLLLLPAVWTAWSDILFLIDFEKLGKNEQGYPEYRHRETGIVFVSLPGGTLLMGN